MATPPKPSELGPSGPVSELEVLAALARAELHARTRYPQLRDIANHLGWRYSGAATRLLHPHLGQLTSAGQAAPTEPLAFRASSQEWRITAAGRDRLATAGVVELPESPQHRRWRQERDVAAWALPAVQQEAWSVTEEIYDLLITHPLILPPLTNELVNGLARRFEKAFLATTLATRMCSQWPEPSDLSRDDPPGEVSRLLPEAARKRRR